uniref:Uncharacterized protein n=1 Tax=Grammatophora oceanica TaxID=210454 RepID=A0A7S1VFA7_9STRA|mmetsp:Transcript_45095/g.66973  ORF Transcript_45095/g.66973 Transcript_45095/m.66973 type:complete len:362 (+) Transcript_45095:127-1212(+)|eukprot:CAMPEP_0194033542 /NCGR_PEP_ID=MMETSP0009_2-20130614/6197_1 /TAXON_ID=210454 /ORGANISM="Grammatophora oceanica, Strain CCMP 410" /LENGTH=361 /DNA_ID=CAMNT_0038674255 /DNA_START=102 /DNA_END=1187 /DNA_ORIENTATION=-
MATPNPNTIKQRRGKAQRTIQWVVLMVVAVGLLVVITVWFGADDSNQQEKQQLRKMIPSTPTKDESPAFQFVPLKQEDVFLQTLKSCLPQENDHCKQYIPPGTTDQRIALLSPPGELATFLERFVKEFALGNDLEGLHLVSTTHIPPYGYGKTHGWTKLIRLVPYPLSLGAVDALQAVVSTTSHNDDDGMEESLQSSLRQVIRWHCRVSHISAHTSVLTLHTNKIQDDPAAALQQVIDFVRTTPTSEKKAATEQGQQTVESIRQQLKALTSRAATTAATWTPSFSFDDILSKELVSSKNLSVWPCPSLWTTANDDGLALPADSLAGQLAKQLVPDCDDSFAQCWVDRDKCEFHGDAECKKK